MGPSLRENARGGPASDTSVYKIAAGIVKFNAVRFMGTHTDAADTGRKRKNRFSCDDCDDRLNQLRFEGMSRARIRLAGERDLVALAEMRYRFRDETGRINEAKPLFVKRCVSWMKKRFHPKYSNWRCWIFEDGKRLLGHVCVQLFEKIPNPVNESEVHAYVTNCYVLPESRNRKIGKRLLQKALSWCRAQGADAVILWPTTASKSFYRRCGFAAASDIFELRDKRSSSHRFKSSSRRNVLRKRN
jgi:GNAT superfamily N-acetyltransferase